MELSHTRAIVHAILDGVLDEAETRVDPFFGLYVPTSVPMVPDEVLDPRQTWENPEEYDLKARELAGRFVDNFKQYEGEVAESTMAAGPPQ
jgi:phosphoenolpyruvate carboxykinase (ATP)